MKKLRIEIKPLRDHLRVEAAGEYDLDEALEGFRLILSACKFTGHTRVMVDFRRMNGIPHATEKVIYALGAEKEYETFLKTGGHEIRVAYLGAGSALNSYEPGLDIAQQRNLPAKIFTSDRDACRWLKIDPSGRDVSP